MRKTLGILAMCTIMGITACSQNHNAAQTPTPSDIAEYRALGRHHITPTGAHQFAWPASGLETRFHGAQLKVTLEDTGANIVDITIDGKTEMLHLKEGVHEYTLLEADNAQDHIVKITRRSEVFDQGLTGFISMDIDDGHFLETPVPEHRIMVLGDSISVGFGAEGADETCEYTPETGAPLRSYVALTAQAFGADLHNNAISGRGLVRNWDLSPAPLMPSWLHKALPDNGPDWDPKAYQPHVILINIGTNDYSKGDPGEKFYEAYVKLLTDLRADYPLAQIYAAYSPMGTINPEAINAVGYTKRALETRRNAGDDKLAYIYFPQAESGHIYGCSYHPGLDSHKTMADVFIKRLKTDMGWKRIP